MWRFWRSPPNHWWYHQLVLGEGSLTIKGFLQQGKCFCHHLSGNVHPMKILFLSAYSKTNCSRIHFSIWPIYSNKSSIKSIYLKKLNYFKRLKNTHREVIRSLQKFLIFHNSNLIFNWNQHNCTRAATSFPCNFRPDISQVKAWKYLSQYLNELHFSPWYLPTW